MATESAPLAAREYEVERGGAERLTVRRRYALVYVSMAFLIAGIMGWLEVVIKAAWLHEGRFDFSAYYAAARLLRLDPHADIYSHSVFAASAIASHVQASPTLLYAYPPLPALLLAPLTVFSYPVASDIFLGINTVIWLACIAIVFVEARHLLGASLAATSDAGLPSRATLWGRLVANPAPLVALAICVPLFSISRPAEWTLGNGQINFVVLLPLVCIPWLTRHRHERWVGVAIAVATMLKLTPGLFLVYLVLRRRWEALAAAIIALAAISLACIAIVGPSVFFEFPAASLRIGSGDSIQLHNQALFAPVVYQLTLLFPSLASASRMCEYALLALLAVEVGVIVWSSRRAGVSGALSERAGESDTLTYALALCCVVLLSPTAWAHHYLWVLPAVAIAGAVLVRQAFGGSTVGGSRHAMLLLGVGVVAAVFIDYPLPFGWDTNPAQNVKLLLGLPLRPWLEEVRPLGALLIVAVLATAVLWNQRRARSRSPDGTRSADALMSQRVSL